MNILSLNNVSYHYRDASSAAVSNVTCSFGQGSLYAIVGPSGSGKTTLLSLLAGLDKPTSGEITFGGENLEDMDMDAYRRTGIAMIFQLFHLFPLLTVLENVCYPMLLCGMRKTDAKPRARDLLDSVGITLEQMKRFPSNLSGGEQQRVAIARSLAGGAKVLLADEPTGNLDIANTGNIIGILHRLAHEDGYCVIVVTHDLEVAETADVVFQMHDGSLT